MYTCRDDVFGFEIIEIFVSFIIGFVGVQCLIYSTTILNEVESSPMNLLM